MSRGNPEFAEYGFKKGDGRGGRPKGAPNKTTRALKEAIILAAEKSKHSKAHDLEGNLLYLADEKPELLCHCWASCCRCRSGRRTRMAVQSTSSSIPTCRCQR